MTSKQVNLYIITHCESCYNQGRIFTGRLNSHLTKNGIEHAKEMAEKLKDTQIDLAIHTSLDRTKETLKYILKYHPKTKVEINDSIIERDYGQLSRKSKDKYQREHKDLFPLYHRSYDVPPPGGESIKQVEARVIPFLEKLTDRMRKENINVLLVCHGNSIRPMIRYFENLSPKEMMALEYTRHHIFHYSIPLKQGGAL
jgi:2,3-bisphosphoglycerate-dependent phosphoglycerate mutase